jgi:RNA polymerase sigma-70 factor (ECF subfamily)
VAVRGAAPELGFRPDVAAAVGRLSVRQRAAVFLTYWEGLRQDEVAARLDISVGSVKRHLTRARAKLKEQIHE